MVVVTVGALTLGCSGAPAPVAPPDVEPADLAEFIIEDYDANDDGSVSADELADVPSIADRFDAFDSSGDGLASREELEKRLSKIFDGQTGLMGASCRVTRKGRPMAGAYVYFVPPPFLEDELPVAAGTTADNGVAHLSIRQEDLPANAPQMDGFVRAGIYSVEIKHPSMEIPEQYNVKTALGREISAEVTIGGPIGVDLDF
jgi:hypothetical protein